MFTNFPLRKGGEGECPNVYFIGIFNDDGPFLASLHRHSFVAPSVSTQAVRIGWLGVSKSILEVLLTTRF